MANKSRWRPALNRFIKRMNEVQFFIQRVDGTAPPKPEPGAPEDPLPLRDRYRCYEYGAVWLHRVVESFILEAVVYAVNRKPTLVASAWGVPLKLTEVNRATAEYLLTQGGYFDLGRKLDEQLARVLPKDHHLRMTVKKYEPALKRLSAARNVAAHDSDNARTTAARLLRDEGYRGGRIGKWLHQVITYDGRRMSRLQSLDQRLLEFFNDIHMTEQAEEDAWRESKKRRRALAAKLKAQSTLKTTLSSR
jgi:hypothetical protein